MLKDVKSLRQFLGLTGCYRHFVVEYVTIASPLIALLGASVPWYWSACQSIAIQQLKAALCAAPVLRYPDVEKPFTVGTDALDYALGAVLQ